MLAFRNAGPLFADVRRAAMVRSVVLDGRVVHWVEIEQRTPSESSLSLAFAESGAVRLTLLLCRLLKVAAQERGVWPDPADLPGSATVDGVVGVRAAAKWRHTPSRQQTSADASALAALRAVVQATRWP